MALNTPRAWLICYDICDPRRLSRFHRFISEHAVPVQYSVFYYEGSAAQLGRLVKEVSQRIDEDVDDVRVYQIPARLDCDVIGRGSLPERGIVVSEHGEALLILTGPASE